VDGGAICVGITFTFDAQRFTGNGAGDDMTQVFFIRHGEHDWLGHTLVGRQAGIPLNQTGREQAEALAAWTSNFRIEAIFTSPLTRATQTAEPMAERLGLPAQENLAFHEIDFGEWTGKKFSELEADPRWHLWNSRRSAGVAPGGERIQEVRERVLRGLEEIRHLGCVAVVSHGDVTKSVLAEGLGFTLDELLQFEISPGSVTVATYHLGQLEISELNCRPAFVSKDENAPNLVL
jgi:probable phosphoglycerate mutase